MLRFKVVRFSGKKYDFMHFGNYIFQDKNNSKKYVSLPYLKFSDPLPVPQKYRLGTVSKNILLVQMWIKTHRCLVSKAVLLLWIFYGVFSVLCLLCLCERLFICALWSPAGKELTSWLSFVMSNCEFVSFLLVSWVRYGT